MQTNDLFTRGSLVTLTTSDGLYHRVTLMGVDGLGATVDTDGVQVFIPHSAILSIELIRQGVSR